MIRRAKIGLGCMLFAACAIPASPGVAQVMPADPAVAGVMGAGSITLEREPELLRMQLQVSAEGKDAREAVAKLKEKEAAAKGKLVKLGAAENSVSFADPQAQTGTQQQQMERMIQMRTGRAPKAAKNQPAAVTVTTTLKSEWPLKAKDPDDLLVEVQELQARIKAADLAGAKGDKASAEEQEIAEEAQNPGNSDGQTDPRDPVYMYVTKISDADREKARADAFQKARTDAERLSKAAGAQIGNLRLLISSAGPNLDPNQYQDMSGMGGSYQRMMYNLMNRQPGEDADASEAIGVQPGKVSYKVTVSASFAVKG